MSLQSVSIRIGPEYSKAVKHTETELPVYCEVTNLCTPQTLRLILTWKLVLNAQTLQVK